MKKINILKSSVASRQLRPISGGQRCCAASFVICLVLAILSFGQNCDADQQGYDQTVGTLANLPTVLSNGVASGFSSNPIPLRPYSGLGLQTIFQGSNLVTAPVTVFVWPSIDGTNVANVTPYAILNYPANGTNAVIGSTNWSNLQLKGIAALFLNISNGTGDNINLNLAITNPATGQIYPGGVLYNRPNQ